MSLQQTDNRVWVYSTWKTFKTLEKLNAKEHLTEREGYKLAHLRCWELWGRAKEHLCWKCTGPAAHWAYDGTDPASKKYSLWPEFYMPMCPLCHKRWDIQLAKEAQQTP
jgi:hypothetical protein